MFFQGSLQEGISTALQQSKQVVCFVTDGSDESQLWETEFLAEDTVKEQLAAQTVVLRLAAGSDEAGYLEALFPVPRKPTLIVIQNGQLKEYIAGGSSKEEFLRRLKGAIAGHTSSVGQSTTSSQAASTSTTGIVTPVEQEDEDGLYGDVATTSSNTVSTLPTLPAPVVSPPSDASSMQESRSPQVQTLLAERARREAEKQAKEAAAREEAKKRAQERREVTASSEGQLKNVNAAESAYASMLRKRKQEEREERQRILRRIEDDKRARRERDAQERQSRVLANITADGVTERAPSSIAQPLSTGSRGGGTVCSLQVRLFDGSTMRTQLPRDATLGSEVRRWIDDNRTDGNAPYTFRVVLTPLPNKAIEPAEEAETLLNLGLAPSATVVLVPRVRVATAFEHTGGLLFRAWMYIYGLLAMFFSAPARYLPSGGETQSADQDQAEDIPLEDLEGSGSSRRRTRKSPDSEARRQNQQLYNGNSLSFESRKDDEDDQNED
ncbi:hypothetical protein BX600DRAFT_304714 [Xylariales sp. PMI_506]|nr:hypothetical protein BX600DRAFT_304714 [Xylariales sp. PMI_506]